jgi:hypothetical protein
MPHNAPSGSSSLEIVIADASPGCAAVAVVEDEGSEGGFRVVLAPEIGAASRAAQARRHGRHGSRPGCCCGRPSAHERGWTPLGASRTAVWLLTGPFHLEGPKRPSLRLLGASRLRAYAFIGLAERCNDRSAIGRAAIPRLK